MFLNTRVSTKGNAKPCDGRAASCASGPALRSPPLSFAMVPTGLISVMPQACTTSSARRAGGA
jgi:hypothetical protein